MSFKEAFERYKTGAATQEEAALVEEELEKTERSRNIWRTSSRPIPGPAKPPTRCSGSSENPSGGAAETLC